jgi:bacterioferritin-associated ferredoxin
MYICICNAVTDKQIEQAVRNGACRMRDLRNQLGVADACACCAESARRCLASALENNCDRSWAVSPCPGSVAPTLVLEAP